MCYIKYNANPLNKNVDDCVIRAISKGLSKDYDEVYMDLVKIGFEIKAMPNSQQTYEKYLKGLGYNRLKLPKKSDNTKYSVKEFMSAHDIGTYILTIQGHMTVVVDGTLYDTWDCSRSKICLCYTKN